MRPTERLRFDLPRQLLFVLAALPAACEDPAQPEPAGLVHVERQPDGTYLAAPDAEPTDRPNFHDFGLVPDGQIVEHTFFLRNDSSNPIEFQRMDASCGCTVPRLSYVDANGERVEGRKRPGPEGLLTLPPGVVAATTLRIDTKAVRTKNLDKLSTVRLITDSPATPFLALEAHLVAEQPFQVVPKQLDLGSLAVGGGGSGTLEIVTAPSQSSRLVELLDVPLDLAARLEVQPGIGDRWKLHVDALEPLHLGHQSFTITIDAVGAEGLPRAPFQVDVSYEGVPDLAFEPTRLHAGVIEPGKAARASAELRCFLAGLRVRIESAEIEGEHAEDLRVDWTPLSSDANGRSDRWRVTLHIAAGLPPVTSLRGTIRLTLDDAQYPSIEVPYVAFGPSPGTDG